ncbi:nuclear transport factor 2 family protein [Lichenibacterium minor]|nr:nuclear transport factor 2 family protein [Lichenibacterium minor]
MTGDKQHDATTEFNEALAAGFAANNFDAIGPFYTEDATLLPPRGKPLDGRAAASAFWASVANRFKSVAFTTVAVKDLGDAARRETGTYVMGGEAQAAEGKYVFVWQLVDGEWQIESAIWNRGGDGSAARRQGQGQAQGQGQGQRRPGAGQGGGYRRGGGGGGQGAGAGQGGYRQGPGAGGSGYRAGGGRPSFQAGGAAGGRRGGGGHQDGGAGGGSLYDGDAGLYSNPKG